MWGQIIQALGQLLSNSPQVAGALSSLGEYGAAAGSAIQAASPALQAGGQVLQTGGQIGSAVQGQLEASEQRKALQGAAGGGTGVIGVGTTSGRVGGPGGAVDPARRAREGLAASKLEGQASGLSGASQDYYLDQLATQMANEQGMSIEQAKQMLQALYGV